MRNTTQRWFEFAGQRSTALGIRVLSAPARPRAAERGSWISVPGRDGDLFRPDGGRADIKLTLSLAAPADRLSAIAQWLSGPGYLITSDRPGAITVDSAQRIAHSGTALLTANLSGDWPAIPPGGSPLSWSGAITSVTLKANYRVE